MEGGSYASVTGRSQHNVNFHYEGGGGIPKKRYAIVEKIHRSNYDQLINESLKVIVILYLLGINYHFPANTIHCLRQH